MNQSSKTLTYSNRPEGQQRLCNLFVRLSECYGQSRPNFGDATEPLRDL